MADSTLAAARTQAIRRYFAAMRRGPDGERDLLELFVDDAVYVEPFTGADEPAIGIAAIRERLQVGWERPLADMQLEVLALEVTGSTATSRWECRSPDLPGGAIRGRDVVTFRGDMIERLEVTLGT